MLGTGLGARDKSVNNTHFLMKFTYFLLVEEIDKDIMLSGCGKYNDKN